MGVLSDLRKRWFVTGLTLAVSLFFTAALLYSTMTYVDVMEARQGVELRGALEGAEELEDGSLLVTFSVEVYNPSDQDLVVHSMSWTVRAENSSGAVAAYLPVTSAYNASSEGTVFGSESARRVVYEAVVSDPAVLGPLRALAEYMSSQGDETTLAALRGFIGYSASQGDEYTLSSLPFVHDYRLVAYTGGFDHDYQYSKELYLNDLVRIERTYMDGEYS